MNASISLPHEWYWKKFHPTADSCEAKMECEVDVSRRQDRNEGDGENLQHPRKLSRQSKHWDWPTHSFIMASTLPSSQADRRQGRAVSPSVVWGKTRGSNNNVNWGEGAVIRRGLLADYRRPVADLWSTGSLFPAHFTLKLLNEITRLRNIEFL